MRTIIVTLYLLVLFSCKNDPKNKVTYYEQHDYCELMAIIDSELTVSKLTFNGNVDIDLANALKTHHLCGIAMSEYELKNGKNEEVRKYARQILLSDTMELAMLNLFLQSKVEKNIAEDGSIDVEVRRAIDKMQHSAHLQVLKDDNDRDYAMLILPQRQCNLDLSELIIHYSTSPDLKRITNSIQQNESLHIELLQLWLLKNVKK